MKFHDELNPKLWSDFELKEEVRDKLLEIASAFTVDANIPADGIVDICITGSSANYNYTPHSDLDLHIIVDYDKLHEDCPLVEGYLWAFKANFNKEHDISIYDIPVEVYAEDTNNRAKSNGVYSVLYDEWVSVPQKLKPTDNDGAVELKFLELKDQIEQVSNNEEAQELLDKIYELRKSGLQEVGELSTENLVFKKLRDRGLIDKLKELKAEQIDRELSLNKVKI